MNLLKPLAFSVTLTMMMSSAIAQSYSQTIFFGDSLSDTGRIKEIITLANPNLGNQLASSFTTNPSPVWATVLATSYGTTAIANTSNNPKGTNYTVGAAQAGRTAPWSNNGTTTDDSLLVSVQVQPMQEQINSYLKQNNNMADPKALYAVWIGANDLFAASREKEINQALALINNSANQAVIDIKTLHDKGAKVILVPNIPDISLTPYVQSQNIPTLTASAKQAAQLYNANVFNGLNTSQANVVPANTFALLQEAYTNPTGFGFKNVKDTACEGKGNGLIQATSESLVCKDVPNAEDYLFADAIHPAGRTHRILAQYYRSILDAPAEIGKISQTLVAQGNTQHQYIHQRLQKLQPNQNHWWIDGQANHSQIHQAKTDDINSLARIGTDIAKGQHHLGVYAQVGQQQFNLGKNTLENQQVGFGLYHRYHQEQLQVQSYAGIDKLDINHQRKINWDGEQRQHSAETDGQRLQASLRGLYTISQGQFHYIPYIGVNYQHLTVNGMLEDQTTYSTAMQFNKHHQTSLQGEIGLNVDYQLTPQTYLYGGLGITHEFSDDHLNITASLPSIPQYSKGFTLPVNKQDDDKTTTNIHIGANWQINSKLNVNGGIQAEKAGDTQENIGGFIGMQGKF